MPNFWEHYPKVDKTGKWFACAEVVRRFGWQGNIIVGEKEFTSLREAYLYARLRALIHDYLYLLDRFAGRGVNWNVRGTPDKLEIIHIDYVIETHAELHKLIDKYKTQLPLAIRKLYMARANGERQLLDKERVYVDLTQDIPIFSEYNQLKGPMVEKYQWSQELAGEPSSRIVIHLH